MSTSKQQVAVIDYGMGNLHSVASALQYVNTDVQVHITADPQLIRDADRVIFPGVGAIRDCVGEIRRLGIDALVQEAIAEKPVLAICVGLQALMTHSEENDGVECLQVLPGEVKFFGENLQEQGVRLKVPHMGWNQVEQTVVHPLWANIDNGSRFYFVHSYYVQAQNQNQVAGQCHYGKDFAAALHSQNLFAVQFHPEKSHTCGLQLLKNFLSWNGQS